MVFVNHRVAAPVDTASESLVLQTQGLLLCTEGVVFHTEGLDLVSLFPDQI